MPTKWGLLNLVARNALQRAIYFKKALHRNTQIRKAPSQIALAADVAELRSTLRELCRPDFDDVEILLSSGPVYRSVPTQESESAISVSLYLADRDGRSLGLVQMHRLKVNHSPFLLDLQLVAEVFQPALSIRVFSIVQGSDRFDFSQRPTAHSAQIRTFAADPVLVLRDSKSVDLPRAISEVI